MYHYGPAILGMIKTTQTFGYNEAKRALKKGSYLSPKQLFEDTKHKMGKELYNYEHFKLGALKALEEKRHNDKLQRNNKVKETVRQVLEELDGR